MFAILRKIARIIFRIVLWTVIGIFGLYLFIGFVAIPIGLPWAVRSQGSKILGHPVFLGSARFQPLFLRLTLHGFKISDNNKQEMVAFQKFWVDVSFLKLLKKEYRIESVGIKGLNVNAELSPGGQINLLALVPKPPQTPTPKTPAPAAPQKTASVPVLPNAVVDEIVLEDGTVTFNDKDIAPGFSARLNHMNLRITGVSTRPDSQVKIEFSSILDEKGKISTEALVKPFVQPLALEATFALNDYAMRALTPYVGKYTGRAVKEGGKLDVKVHYLIEDNQLKAGHKVLIQNFNFGEKVESKDALGLPFGLAVALLEDPSGKIDISLPVNGDIADPKFEYFHLVGQVARNFFMKLITAPFKVLFALVPAGEAGTEELGSVSFAPGVSVLTAEESKKVALLAGVMKERPKLSLELNGSYDTAVDWKAMKTKAFEDEYTYKRENSAFTDFRLYEDMYKIQFGLRNYWALARKYTVGKVTDEKALMAEMRRLIIEKGQPQKIALVALAQARAKAVYDAVIAAGFDAAKVTIGDSRSTEASMGAIPMEFTLTVFEDTKTPTPTPSPSKTEKK